MDAVRISSLGLEAARELGDFLQDNCEVFSGGIGPVG
jgi:hypothetical protein